MIPEGDGRGNPVLHGSVEQLTNTTEAADRRHVGVVAGRSIREWTRLTGSSGPGATSVDRHAVKIGGEFRETASASVTTRQMRPDLTVTTAGQPIAESWFEAVQTAVDQTERPIVSIDDPRFLLLGDDPDARIEELSALADEVPVHIAVPDESVNVGRLARLVEPAGEGPHERLATDGVEHLRQVNPTNFGYLRSHWREARRGLEAIDMTYPQSKQVHDAIPDPETTPRMLGAALQAFVELGALDVWGDTVAANRYDMTAYDPERAAVVGRVLDSIEAE